MSEFVFSRKPIEIESGEGVFLHDTDGRSYLDMGASYACTPLGHSPPAVVEALTAQAEELLYVQGSYPVAVRDRLHERLGRLAPDPLDRVWLCNSGTEANEAALKFARHATGRSKIVATKRAFHGRTMGSLAATWDSKYRDGFEPLVGDVAFVPFGDADAIEHSVDEETAAVIVEPIQGEGGINPAGEAYLKRVREVTETNGAALIFDEIQTGLGRTGSMWVADRVGVAPDVLTTGKGLASGLPMGATLVREWIAADAGNHGSTFSGGPTVAAAAEATLAAIEDRNLPAHADEMGDRLRRGLAERLEGGVRDVRGRGLMVGVEVKRNGNGVVRRLAMDERVLTLPAGRTVVRLLPPLIVGPEHVDRTVEAFERVVPEVAE
ncbi:MAG: aspartate aminotransferase family protein, partial [Halodesulfurarchaeum sp.]